MGDEQVVQPAGAGEADVIGGVEHGRGIAQQFARALDGDRLQERLRRQPGPALEYKLEMRGGKADVFGDRLDRGLIAPARRDELDRALDGGIIGAEGGREHRRFYVEHGGRGPGEVSNAGDHAAVLAGARRRPKTTWSRSPENDRQRDQPPFQQRQRVARESGEIRDQGRGWRGSRPGSGARQMIDFSRSAAASSGSSTSSKPRGLRFIAYSSEGFSPAFSSFASICFHALAREQSRRGCARAVPVELDRTRRGEAAVVATWT